MGLWVNADGYSTFTQANIVLNGGTILGDDGNNTLASPITLNTDSSIQAQWNNKEVILAGPVTGIGGLLVNGAMPAPRSGNAAGTVVLTSNANNWLGNTTITSGNLQIGMGNAANIPDNAGTGASSLIGAEGTAIRGQTGSEGAEDQQQGSKGPALGSPRPLTGKQQRTTRGAARARAPRWGFQGGATQRPPGFNDANPTLIGPRNLDPFSTLCPSQGS